MEVTISGKTVIIPIDYLMTILDSAHFRLAAKEKGPYGLTEHEENTLGQIYKMSFFLMNPPK
jgi:hypothetical protein